MAAEFEIKIAKAKDLPLSWFDLVLRPEKFKQHIKTLEDNPNIEPTGLQLVATFLEKGGALEGQTLLPPGDGGKEGVEGLAVLEERRQRLVNCALFIGSFMQWDLALFEKSLPPAVSYSLLVQLTKHYPLTTARTTPPPPPTTDQEEEEEEEEDSNLPREPPATLMAHVLYCHWVVRFLTLSHLPPDPRHLSHSWDISCATPEQIKSLLEPQLSHCVEFLEEVCRHCRGYQVPVVGLSLPIMGRRSQGGEDSVELSLSSSPTLLSTPTVLCQIHYSLGCHYFWHDNFQRAHSRLRECARQLKLLSGCPPLVDPGQLRGFTSACAQVRTKRRAAGREGEEEEEGEMESEGLGGGRQTLLEKLELCKIGDIEKVPEQLIQDLTSPSIPLLTCTSLHRDLARRAEDAPQEPSSKRAKLDPSLASSSLPLHSRVAVCNAVRATLEAQPVQPPFWTLSLSPSVDPSLYQFLFHVCGEVVDKKCSDSTKTLRLQTFVRSVCCKAREPSKVWQMLLNSPAKSLATQQDAELMERLFPSKPMPVPTTVPPFSSSSSSLSLLHEKRILTATNCQDLLTAVEDCFKSLPASEHKTLALRWVGPGDEFMNSDLISDLVLLTKYNAMVHRAQLLKRAQNYAESGRFLRAALGLMPRPSSLHTKSSSSSSSHPKPDQVLLDIAFWVELKGANLEARTLSPQESSKRFSGLADKAKNFCRRSYSHPDRSDPMAVCLAAAFLLNTHNYQHLISFDHPFTPGKVAPRLAIAALAMKEDRDARKSIRDVFSAVLSVFSTPVSSEMRSEVGHKQLQLRSQFDVLVENLEDPGSLSLLLMALVRIWSILKKPDEEIGLMVEHAMYWPTVIGSPGSVNADHVFRTLSSTLHHSLTVHPNYDSWMILHAEIHYATGKYGAALLNYLKAGAVTSRHFEDEVPPLVWSMQVYRKMISCCTQLNLHTHAVLLCQLLVPVDYELAFSLLSTHSSLMAESYFTYFWDMVIIEYLIYINAKRGDKNKQSLATQIAGQPELNCNNSLGVLARAAQVRRRKLLQSFYDQSFSTL